MSLHLSPQIGKDEKEKDGNQREEERVLWETRRNKLERERERERERVSDKKVRNKDELETIKQGRREATFCDSVYSKVDDHHSKLPNCVFYMTGT
jgi:hypothetical protein